MTFHEWKKKTFTWVDNDVARYMQRAWAASTKEQAKQKAKLKAENAKLQESNKAMARLLKERHKHVVEVAPLCEDNEKEELDREAAKIERVLTAAGRKVE